MQISCKYFVKIYPDFIGVFAIISGIVSKVLFSNCLLVLNRDTINFCILNLCPAALLNSLINSNGYFVDSLGIYIYIIMSSVNKRVINSTYNITFKILIC